MASNELRLGRFLTASLYRPRRLNVWRDGQAELYEARVRVVSEGSWPPVDAYCERCWGCDLAYTNAHREGIVAGGPDMPSHLALCARDRKRPAPPFERTQWKRRVNDKTARIGPQPGHPHAAEQRFAVGEHVCARHVKHA